MEAAYRSADADGAPVDLPLRPELEREPGVVESSGLAEVPDLSGLVGCGGFCELAFSHVVALLCTMWSVCYVHGARRGGCIESCLGCRQVQAVALNGPIH